MTRTPGTQFRKLLLYPPELRGRIHSFTHLVPGPPSQSATLCGKCGKVSHAQPRCRFHNQRGTAEQWIKKGRSTTIWDRLSCHRFRANEVRFLLGVMACNLGNLLRRLVLSVAIQSSSLTSFQQRLCGSFATPSSAPGRQDYVGVSDNPCMNLEPTDPNYFTCGKPLVNMNLPRNTVIGSFRRPNPRPGP